MADKIVVLRAGRVEQIGTPEALYTRPCNTFVAGFIGSPRMNLMPVQALDGAPALRAQLPAQTHEVGVRPEHWQLCAPGEGLALTVRSSEYLGAQRLLQARLGEHRVELLVDVAHAPAAGDVIHASAPLAHWHAFDAQGQRLEGTRA